MRPRPSRYRKRASEQCSSDQNQTPIEWGRCGLLEKVNKFIYMRMTNMSKCAISQIVQTSQHFVIRMYLEYLLEAAQTSLKFGVAAQNNSKMLLFRPPASVISIPLNTGTCGCISLITFGISGCKQIAPSKGSHLYPSDNAKRQFDVIPLRPIGSLVTHIFSP